jgi:hypothetical protein
MLAQNGSGKSSECNEVHSVEDHEGKQAFSVHDTHSHPTLYPTPFPFPALSVSKVYLDLEALQAKVGLTLLTGNQCDEGFKHTHTFV